MSMSFPHLSGLPIIIGGGIAGLLTALHLAPEPVLLLSKSPLGADTSSAWAQGGLAASFASDDNPALHLADTLAAGGGLCNAEVARHIVYAAPAAIENLSRLGVSFDRVPNGDYILGLEAAHSRRRIVHAKGDGSGYEIMRALVAAVRFTPSIRVIEGVEARRVVVEDNAVSGVLAYGAAGPVFFGTGRIVLATGGIGGLFFDTTNPLGAFGQGLALAARAGAALADLEFIQFHPTAFDAPGRPLSLISEAVRGEGAVLVDETGRRFLGGLPGAELAPRDILTRAVWQHMAKDHHIFLDVRESISEFAERFPGIALACKTFNIDPARDLVPIRPAQHYHMGGVAVDEAGRSSITGLWACGEVACTGIHGANRLASNSLTEAAVCSRWVAESVAGTPTGRSMRAVTMNLPAPPCPAPVRPVISRTLGVLREYEGLKEAVGTLLPIAESGNAAADPAVVGLMIAVAALQREESRGAHYRTDFPEHAAVPRRSMLYLDDALRVARELEWHSIPLVKSA